MSEESVGELRRPGLVVCMTEGQREVERLLGEFQKLPEAEQETLLEEAKKAHDDEYVEVLVGSRGVAASTDQIIASWMQEREVAAQ